jgi:thioredoxin 1
MMIRKEERTMTATRPVTDESFESEVLRSEKPVLVDFWASWCPPCHAIAPILEQFASEHAERIDVVKLNIEENQMTPAKYQVTSIPTLMVFQKGEVVKTLIGAMPRIALEAQLAEYLTSNSK